MYIEIPNKTNKYNFVCELLDLLQNTFCMYEFINCTQSPLNDFDYSENNGLYYRNLSIKLNIDISDPDYIKSYDKDNLLSQGISLQEYIDMCLLFELEEVMLISQKSNPINLLSPLITISICPDGLNEIHFSGNQVLLNEITTLIKGYTKYGNPKIKH